MPADLPHGAPSFGVLRLAAAAPVVHVADPVANAAEILKTLEPLGEAHVVVLPELALTGYTCEDLFTQRPLLDAAIEGLLRVAAETLTPDQLVAVGLPLAVGNSLYNCAAVLGGGRVLGVVPKQHLPGYREFYEPRRFTGADGSEPPTVRLGGEDVPFGIDLLFQCVRDGEPVPGAVIGVEICEDLWVPCPPSAFQALAGATVLLNLSGSNETVGKGEYRRQLVTGQSARCVAAYVYAGAGPTESTTDLVLGGECLIASNGGLLARGDSYMLGDHENRTGWRGAVGVSAEVDLPKLLHDRRVMTSFQADRRVGSFENRTVEAPISPAAAPKEVVNGTPFVPRSGPELAARCREIFSIQCCGLAKRLSRLGETTPLQIGVSGGLDSTLSLLVACKTLDGLGQSRERIHGLTMPGFGTTDRTRTNADALMEQLGVTADTIDIRQLCLDAFRGIGHKPFGIDPATLDMEEFEAKLTEIDPGAGDLTFENVQARIRTFLLMSRGFVLGTGDMSELALGWCTYNADHMSMYNVNCSIPKTLVAFLVRHAADTEFDGPARETLHSIADTVISPELLPARSDAETGDAIAQSTEDALGPYELHDFFLYHVVRNGFGPAKILDMASRAEFRGSYEPAVIRETLRTFYKRFFQNQFKRSCVPDGPKVGTVSLSPRGDWRMPSDAEASAWLEEI
ncbi:NAD(+) synthase [Alienimonas chondri]|uniref:Glutamine-dependent NAD(+) synthetase n=1 Tax=Alienimonas chondri TaxID=2681879 RepID=A0ABX1VAM2_9PLAN|nr:NAD(+) synthase [Alienimonas chondri]NNJ24922.1 Glutamine-dependent NAD(+) synthetase [Alienimonas chondri]